MKRLAHLLLLSTVLGFSFGPSPVLAMDENDIEKCNRYYKSKTSFKEIPITEVTCLFPEGRRQLIKGFVPGDGDCSLHTLKVLFPHKDINRQTFFNTLVHSYRTGDPDLKEHILTELLNEVFLELLSPFTDRTQRPGGSSPALIALATQMEARVGDIIRTFVKPNWQRDGLTREEEALCQFTRYRAAETPIGLDYSALRDIHTRIYTQLHWNIDQRNCPNPYNQQAMEGLAEVIWGQVNHPLHKDTVDQYLTSVRDRLREDDDLFLQILPYMASNDIFLTSVGDEAHIDGRGTLDLACRLFKLNVVLFFDTRDGTHKTRSIYRYGEPSTPEKFMLLANGHYSPLAAQGDYATQQEMVNKFVALMRLRQGVFKTFDSFSDLDREFPTQSEGVARHMRWPIYDPASGQWQDYRHPEAVAHPVAASAFSSAPPPASYSPSPSGYGASAYGYGGPSGYGASSHFDVADLPAIPSYPLAEVDPGVEILMIALQQEIADGSSAAIVLQDVLRSNRDNPIYRQAVRNLLPMLTRPFEQTAKRDIEDMLDITEGATARAPATASYPPLPSSYDRGYGDTFYGSPFGYGGGSHFSAADLVRHVPYTHSHEDIPPAPAAAKPPSTEQVFPDEIKNPNDLTSEHFWILEIDNDVQGAKNFLLHAVRNIPSARGKIDALIARVSGSFLHPILDRALPLAIEELERKLPPEVAAASHSSNPDNLAATGIISQRQEADERKNLEDFLRKQDFTAAFQKTKSQVSCSDEEIVKFLLESNGYEYRTLSPKTQEWVTSKIKREVERRELEDFLSKQNYPAAFQKVKNQVSCSDEEIIKFLLESNGFTQWDTLTPETKRWVTHMFQGSL